MQAPVDGQKIRKPPLRMAQFSIQSSISRTTVDRSRPRLRLWNAFLALGMRFAAQLDPLATEVQGVRHSWCNRLVSRLIFPIGLSIEVIELPSEPTDRLKRRREWLRLPGLIEIHLRLLDPVPLFVIAIRICGPV